MTANGLVQRNGDVNFAFRQNSNFWYLTGLNEPDLVLVIDKDKDYIILPERQDWRDIAEGRYSEAELSSRSGIINILDNKAGWKQLSSRLKKTKHVATTLNTEAFRLHYGIYPNPALENLISRLKVINANLEFLDLRPQFAKMRSIKQAPEINALKSAIDITNKAFTEVRKQLKNLNSEREVETILTASFSQQGAQGHAFTPIVASGENACTIHYFANKSRLSANGLLVIDAGAEVENYSADIARTYAIKAATKRQQAVFKAVNEAQDFAKAQLKPGLIIIDYEQLIEHYMGEKLRELGLIKSIDRPSVRKYYPHATSHFLGLDTHDIGNYDQPLKANMVLTAEPGIYIPEEKIGIRLEDDILITKNGAETLGAALPLRLS
jgi:Xaa-Pro aminopeptidase